MTVDKFDGKVSKSLLTYLEETWFRNPCEVASLAIWAWAAATT